MAQNQFARPVAGRASLIEPITPIVKNPPTYPELSGEPGNAVATMHSFDCLPSKLVAVPLCLFSLHFVAPFPQSVHRSADELECPFTSIRGAKPWRSRSLQAELLGCARR